MTFEVDDAALREFNDEQTAHDEQSLPSDVHKWLLSDIEWADEEELIRDPDIVSVEARTAEAHRDTEPVPDRAEPVGEMDVERLAAALWEVESNPSSHSRDVPFAAIQEHAKTRLRAYAGEIAAEFARLAEAPDGR